MVQIYAKPLEQSLFFSSGKLTDSNPQVGIPFVLLGPTKNFLLVMLINLSLVISKLGDVGRPCFVVLFVLCSSLACSMRGLLN